MDAKTIQPKKSFACGEGLPQIFAPLAPFRGEGLGVRGRFHKNLYPILFLPITLLLISQAFSSEPPPQLGTVRLTSGDIYKGELVANPSPSAIPSASETSFFWSCPSFLNPLEIRWSDTDSLSFARRPTESKTSQEPSFVFELWTGECFTGSIDRLDEKEVHVRSPRFATHAIPISALRTILRVVEGEEKEPGLLPAENWKQTIPPHQTDSNRRWTIEVGTIQTETSGAAIEHRVFIPDVNSMEIDAAWSHSSPSWVLTLGNPRQLELRVRKIDHRQAIAVTLLFEEKENADIATAIIPYEGQESLRIRLLSDYIRGRFALQLHGKTIAEIRGKEKQRGGGLQPLTLTNVGAGGMTLRELRISRSIFSIAANDPEEGTALDGEPIVLLANSEDYRGTPADFRADDQTFGFLGSSKGLGRVSLGDVERIEFPRREKSPSSQKEEIGATTPLYFVELQDGSRYSSRTIEQQRDRLRLKNNAPFFDIECNLEEIISIHTHHPGTASSGEAASSEEEANQPQRQEEQKQDEWVMRLRTASAFSTGKLTSPTDKKDPNQILWSTQQLVAPVPLLLDRDGTIDIARGVTVEDKKSPPRTRETSPGTSLSSMEQYGRLLIGGEPSLYLKMGDAIPAKVESIRTGIVTANCDYFGKRMVPSDQVHGYRQLVYTGVDAMESNVLKRLLTVPRMSRNTPPTHLIVSREGDAVRGNLVEMDTDAVVIEVRGEPQRIWLKSVAEIVWLQPQENQTNEDGGEEEKPDSTELEPEVASRPMLQTILQQGAKISLIPTRIEGETLLGTHPILGECEVPFRDSVRILLGREIEANAQSSRFTKWKLRNAIDPKFVQQAAEAEAIASGNSKWIGQLAPNFALEMLNGTWFDLGQRGGRVIVLDFWASWCGPCMKSLPEVANVVTSFPAQDVELLAVNVEEPPQVARLVAASMGIQGVVAMDRKGEVSRMYEAQAIPYTVVIDRKGIIRAVFLGNNPDTAMKLREAISAALE